MGYRRRTHRAYLEESIQWTLEDECAARVAGDPDNPADPQTIEANRLQVERLKLELRLENLLEGRRPDTRTAEMFPELIPAPEPTPTADDRPRVDLYQTAQAVLF